MQHQPEEKPNIQRGKKSRGPHRVQGKVFICAGVKTLHVGVGIGLEKREGESGDAEQEKVAVENENGGASMSLSGRGAWTEEKWIIHLEMALAGEDARGEALGENLFSSKKKSKTDSRKRGEENNFK